jgi:hypothetical protein
MQALEKSSEAQLISQALLSDEQERDKSMHHQTEKRTTKQYVGASTCNQL